MAGYDLARRLAAEALGTALLVATVVGSGIMAETLTKNVALALLGNTIATGAMLVVLVTTLGPISGAHLNPAVSLAALVGPAQVAARLAEFSLLRRASPIISARLAASLHPVGAILLAVIGAPAAIPFVLLHGAGNGMLTIRPRCPAARAVWCGRLWPAHRPAGGTRAHSPGRRAAAVRPCAGSRWATGGTAPVGDAHWRILSRAAAA